MDDLLTLSFILSQPDPSRLDWSDLLNSWVTVAAPWPSDLACIHLYQAEVADGTPGELDATLARSLADGLPVQLPDRWWTAGTRAGDHLVTYQPVERENPRSLLVLAPADRSTELNSWTWSDGSPSLPPSASRPPFPLSAAPVGPPSAPSIPATAAAPATADDPFRRRVLVCTSDPQVQSRMHDFLRSIGLSPVERDECIDPDVTLTPGSMDIMVAGMRLARVTIVVATSGEVIEGGRTDTDQGFLVQALLALTLARRQHLLVVAGSPELPPEIHDRGIPLTDSPLTKQSLANRLRAAGCEPDTTGSAWLESGVFEGLDAYKRRPR
ncbi:hypothetical protein JKJ07_07940 [Actinoplanes sp. LDG1-01]|uniref:CASPASE and TPR Repeat-Associated N-terminal domain-containing protein n=1 Tax=Paractinoplanes lichenicola TaxID=2802976 RepID=A0ABS1VHU9_9ACTN|nr:hypothetical protein [Actinoplanes lichenicola]